MPVRVHFMTLGCPKNEVDSDRMRAATAASAYVLADDLDSADVVVVNTCAFIQEATEESIATVMDLASGWKQASTGRRIIVAGCMPSRYGDELDGAMAEADAFVPVADEPSLIAVIERLTGETGGAASHAPARMPSAASTYLQIADGCFRSCTYCTIPSIRGPYRSTPRSELLAEARMLVSSGARELILIGQDTSAWGRDLGNPDLPGLVRDLARIDGVDRLRLMYVQPDGITDELIEAMASEPSVCHYLDMPLQHASRTVLSRMARTGDGDTYLNLISKVRSVLPDVTLRTTLIAGFPGETRADVAQLHSFIRAAGFDYVGVFAYSPESGTRAAELPGQIPTPTRRARAQRLRDVAEEVSFERLRRHVGSECTVLVEGVEDDVTVGRTCGQAPEVDGMTFLDTPVAVGNMVRARIVDTIAYDLVGEVIG